MFLTCLEEEISDMLSHSIWIPVSLHPREKNICSKLSLEFQNMNNNTKTSIVYDFFSSFICKDKILILLLE